MGARRKQMFDRILVLRLGTFQPLSSTSLGTIGTDGRSLDVTSMTDRHHHVLFGDQILNIDVAEFFTGDLGATFIPMLLDDLIQVISDDLIDIVFITQDTQVFTDLIEQFAVFVP